MACESWFIARTNPNQETVAVVFLRMLGTVQTFLPYVSRKVLYKGRIVIRRELMFPSYLFVSCLLDDYSWSAIHRTPGIARLMLRVGEFFPKEIDSGVIEAIKERMVGGTVRLLTDRDFHDRQHVRITQGKYTGVEGLFAHDAAGRVGAIIKLFNRDQWVPVAEEALTAT